MYEFILANRVNHELEPGILVNISKIVTVRIEAISSATAVTADIDLGKQANDITSVVLGIYSSEERAKAAFDELIISLNDSLIDYRVYRMVTDTEAQHLIDDTNIPHVIDRGW